MLLTDGEVITHPHVLATPRPVIRAPRRHTATDPVILYSGPKQASTTRPLSLLTRKGLNHDTHPRSARNARPPICDHWPTRLCTAPSGQRATRDRSPSHHATRPAPPRSRRRRT